MKFLKPIIALVLLFVMPVYAQSVKLPVVHAVTVKELQEKVHPADTTAAAAYQYHYGATYFELVDNYWVMTTEIFNRIKIYKKEGYNYADESIVFYSGSRKGRGKFYEAATYNLVNGKVSKSQLNADGIFEDEPEKDYTRMRIKMPNVQVGSIIEYKYKIQTPYFTEFEDFYFQYDIPVDKTRYDLAIPGFFLYNVYTVGYADIKKEEARVKDNYELNARELIYAFYADNVKALHEEPYVNNMDNYTAMIKHELAEVNMPHTTKKKYATDWTSVAKSIYGLDDFGKELKQSSYFEQDINALIATAKTEDEKADLIFNYVKKRMTWNELNGFTCRQGVKKAYEAGSGNAAEINLMLTAMLRHAGLDANPVVTSTRAHGIAIFPTRTAYNYVVCALRKGDKQILLDATSKYAMPDILPVRVINWSGRLIKKNGDNEEIDLMPKNVSRETISVQAEVAPDGIVTGVARDMYFDYNAYVYRERYAELKEDAYLDKLEKKYPGITITDYKLVNDKDATKPLQEQYSFKHTALCDVMGNKIYINPVLYFAEIVNPFRLDKREYPVDFVFPYNDRYTVSIKVPEGYKVESLPEKLQVGMESGYASFNLLLQQSGDVVQIVLIKQVGFPIVGAEHYQDLKTFYGKITDKQREKIVFVKK